MHCGAPLAVIPYSSARNPLSKLSSGNHQPYINAYLVGAGVETVVVEENYFDRDYLDEFSAYYSKSAHGYKNICKRLHFFSRKFSVRLFNRALSGSSESEKKLQDSYLGFVVLRPLNAAPFGRTLLAWYKNRDPHSERITPTLRSHTCNILGLRLYVCGIPWQQQDRGVSACATVALWSMFHSAAFDANHSIPTTVEITRNAHNSASGKRAFPSTGLGIDELQEAVYSQGLTPKLIYGGVSINTERGKITGFNIDSFASICASNIRSGYTMLLVGDYIHDDFSQSHAIVCIGFREMEQEARESGSCSTMDSSTKVFYIHDDNIGPNVRCTLIEVGGLAVLKTEPPEYVDKELAHPKAEGEFQFRPVAMLIAVHNEIRMDASSLTNLGWEVARSISELLNNVYEKSGLERPAVSYNTQFKNIRSFFTEYLAVVYEGNGSLMGRVRRSIGENAPPLCLHVGLVSVAILTPEVSRVIDVLYDTTDSVMRPSVLAHIVYDSKFKEILDCFGEDFIKQQFGCQILGY